METLRNGRGSRKSKCELSLMRIVKILKLGVYSVPKTKHGLPTGRLSCMYCTVLDCTRTLSVASKYFLGLQRSDVPIVRFNLLNCAARHV